MSVSPLQLRDLAVAGAPLGDVLGEVHVGTDSVCLWVHAAAGCDPQALPVTDPAGLHDRLGAPCHGWPMLACADCRTTAAAAALGARLRALDATARHVQAVDGVLRATAEKLTDGRPVHVDELAMIRGWADPTLQPTGRSRFDDMVGVDLPTPLRDWAVGRLAAAHTRGRALWAQHRARQPAPARRTRAADRYVVVHDPAGVLATSIAPTVARQALAGLYDATPVAWWTAGDAPAGLYRLPGAQARAVAAGFGEGRSPAFDGGPVDAGDTTQLLADAGALYSPGTAGAPLADPTAALALARDLTA